MSLRGPRMAHLFLALCAVSCKGPADSSHDELFEQPHTCTSFVGVDAKAVQSEHFPAHVLNIALADVPCAALSFPWHTFGTDNSKLDAYFEDAKGETLLIISLFNATCIRNDNCAEGDLFAGMDADRLNVYIEAHQEFVLFPLRARLKEIGAFLSLLPANVTPAVSLGLEDEFTDEAAEIVASLIRSEIPGVTIVSNPLVGVRSASFADHHEVHGLMTRCENGADIISQDGAIADDGDDSALLSSGSGCLARLLWRPEWQGRSRDGESNLTPASEAPRGRAIHFSEEEAREVNAKLKAAQ